MKGVYVLLIKLNKKRKIKIGKRGVFCFPAGRYIYVGSAMNNLEKRIERHKSRKKRMHWHIDYFLKYANIINVLKIETKRKIECSLASKIKGEIIAEKFGSMDCKCKSHFFLLPS